MLTVAALLALATVAIPTLTAPMLPVASAANCPDAELIFARGRMESPGAGQIGNALVASLRSKTGKNVALYAVKYPADTQIDIGANDMSARVQYMASSCPDTRLVLGGYSLGAAVTDVVLAVPFGFFGFKNPLPPGLDQKVAAVALFGNGIAWVGPISNFNPIYKERTIELCHGDDPICNPTDPENWQDYWADHLAPAYIKAGMVTQAADFVAPRI
ncbi:MULTISPECIES: cutinase family protein [Mycobacteriaceae]|uniref:cutinase family protein n=1 Tax=Mycobacteriaceae TaxID=1762 RepID=UPI00031B733E|nr:MULTISPECIES: cutinase family protein [Mycobacteriaceae]AMO08131.1 cutinase [Mycolicibacterium neoaurum]AXK78550.1 cutinase family protein [Mycolicibacterium neoaurum]KUM10568.1 cutinase [Mycolicibacterium neoaurum]WBP97173.1 cutinase family protein [Mycolicibacterium neoaurum]WBS10900.1 cutinase family protein [Mycolicibacterium neoaurum]